MLHITICDDEASQSVLLSQYVREWQESVGIEAEIETFDTADRFFFAWEEKKQTDILLLDIEMPGMDGMTLAQKLREQGDSLQIIFVTGKPDYVFLGYEVEAVSYLMKPVKKEQLFACLDRAKERCGKKEPELVAEIAGEVQKIKVRDICYLESEAHDTLIYLIRLGEIGKSEVTGKPAVSARMAGQWGDASYKTEAGQENIVRSKKGIHSLELELSEKSGHFFKPHRSYFVNLAHVEKITRKEIVVDTGAVIPIARGKWEELNLAYLKFCRRIEE